MAASDGLKKLGGTNYTILLNELYKQQFSKMFPFFCLLVNTL